MIFQRQRGLTNLHAFGVTMIMTLLFLAYANIASSHWLIPLVDLDPGNVLMPYVLAILGGMAVGLRFLQGFANRFNQLSWIDSAQITSRQTIAVALFIFALMFATKDRGISRIFLGSYLGLFWGLGLILNRAMPRFLSRQLFERDQKAPTLFIGSANQSLRLKDWMKNKEVLGILPIGILTEEGVPSKDTVYPFLGPIESLSRVIEQHAVAQVIVLSIPTHRLAGRLLIETCQERGCRLLIYSNLAELLQHPLMLVREDGHTFYALQDEPLEDPFNRILKRSFDIMFSLPVVVLVLPPLCAWVWLVQRWQAPGGLFFVQERAGRRGRRFNLFKFRSMFDAGRNPEVEAVQARKADNRVYAFGRFIRRTSLDEFPQFFNVLRGDMSIVGPRPHMLVHDEEFSRFYKGYRTRHFTKPGITGLAQIRGYRGEITDPELLQRRVENDLFYIANWSIWLDLQITIKTARQVVWAPNTAY